MFGPPPAGTNRTSDVARMTNLLQVSSAFGRAMEAVDTTAICTAIYRVLRRWRDQKCAGPSAGQRRGRCCGGVPFPTNLDLDQPVGSLAPQSQADLVHQALAEDWDDARLTEALAAQQARRLSALG